MFTKHVYFGRNGDENFGPGFTDDEDFVNFSPMDTDPTNKKTVFYQADQIPMDVIKEGIKYLLTPDLSQSTTLEERQEAKESFVGRVFQTCPGIYLFSILHYNDVLECYLCEESPFMLKGVQRLDFMVTNLRKGYVSSAITISPEAVKEAVAQAVNLLKIGNNRYYFGTQTEVISVAALSAYYKTNTLSNRVSYCAFITFCPGVPYRILDAYEALLLHEAMTTNKCCGVDLLTFFNFEPVNKKLPSLKPKLVIFNNKRQVPSYALSRSLITELISASPEEIQNVTQDDILRAYRYNNVNSIADLAKIRHLPITQLSLPNKHHWVNVS